MVQSEQLQVFSIAESAHEQLILDDLGIERSLVDKVVASVGEIGTQSSQNTARRMAFAAYSAYIESHPLTDPSSYAAANPYIAATLFDYQPDEVVRISGGELLGITGAIKNLDVRTGKVTVQAGLSGRKKKLVLKVGLGDIERIAEGDK